MGMSHTAISCILSPSLISPQRRPQVFRFSIDHKPSCEGRETCSFSKPMISPCSEAVLLIKMMLSEIGITGAGAEDKER